MQVESLQALLLIAKVHLASDNAGAALPYVLSSLLHATAWQNDMVVAESLLALVYIWVQLCPSAFPESQHLMREVMPLLATAGGRMHDLMAKSGHWPARNMEGRISMEDKSK